METYSDVINTCFSSQRLSITGFYYYDSVLEQVRLITESKPFFTDFDCAFGVRWNKLFHKIIKHKKATKFMTEKFMTCLPTEHRKIKA